MVSMQGWPILTRLSTAIAVAISVAIAISACAAEAPLDLSPQAATGRDIANANGCASCHGKNGQGNTGPSWQGLYLTRVKLDDEATVLADDEYLYRSITDPSGQIKRDWTLKMPENDLTDDQVFAIIDYIKELQ